MPTTASKTSPLCLWRDNKQVLCLSCLFSFYVVMSEEPCNYWKDPAHNRLRLEHSTCVVFHHHWVSDWCIWWLNIHSWSMCISLWLITITCRLIDTWWRLLISEQPTNNSTLHSVRYHLLITLLLFIALHRQPYIQYHIILARAFYGATLPVLSCASQYTRLKYQI